MNLARYLTSALSAVSLIAAPVAANAAGASASAAQRDGAAVETSEGIGGGLDTGILIILGIAVFAVVLALTVTDGGNSEEPTSP